ncbi:hypothetical protein WMF04_18315 [Sorangium sp. So ce260]|uniref:hypothetical protein n=1 Tax=Sorangium sp. So ce260 TaxID=3133291 RepID=UPI003F60A677
MSKEHDLSPGGAKQPLTISLHVGMGGELASIRVAQRGASVAAFILEAGGSREVAVERGPAIVEARLPNGEVLVKDVLVDDAPASASFQMATRSHEWLGWEQYLRGGVPRERPAVTLEDVAGTIDVSIVSGTIRFVAGSTDDATELKIGGLNEDVVDVRVDHKDATLLLVGPGDWGHGRAPVRLLLALAHADHVDADELSFRASVTVRDPILATLGYVGIGDIPSARVASDIVVARARSAFYSKKQNPHLAAAAAYVLLRLRLIEPFDEWFDNLMNWFPELPDGAVAAAWKAWLLRGDEAGAREALKTAAGRGLPLYTTGVSLLIEGLSLLCPEWEGLAAWKRVRRFIDPSAIFTTLRIPRVGPSDVKEQLPPARPFNGRSIASIANDRPPPNFRVFSP